MNDLSWHLHILTGKPNIFDLFKIDAVQHEGHVDDSTHFLASKLKNEQIRTFVWFTSDHHRITKHVSRGE